MKKILYIGHLIEKPTTGGEVCCFYNQLVLKEIFGNGFHFVSVSNENKIQIFINKFLFFYPGLSIKTIDRILSQIKLLSPEYVFIETAQYGILTKLIKLKIKNIKVITFFHNIEIQYAKSYLSLKNPKSWYFYLLTKYNETKAVKYSDYKFAINDTDSKLMYKLYGIEADFIMPFSIENKVSREMHDSLLANNRIIYGKKALFVGSNFFGNTDGLHWFINTILPKLDIHLTIVGKGMSKAFTDSEKVTVFDFVDDISSFYRSTEFVLLPIISGGGMKTKVAEAMMWGKVILATENAFVGYNTSDCNGLYCCNSFDDYAKAISDIQSNNFLLFNENIHQQFLNFHSIQTTVEKTKVFFINRGI